MLRDVLAWAFRRADASPEFTAATCLVHHGVGCTACADACPHDAITITRTVAIDPIDCTGCGLCVAACPSHALAPRAPAPTARDVRCSQVAGDAASVTCLARLQPSDLVRLGATADTVTLGRGACSGCTVGGTGVPDAIADAVAAAERLLAVHGRAPDFVVAEVERLDPSLDPRALSRRDLLRSGWDRVKDVGGAVLAPLERLAPAEDEGATDRPPLPAEHRRRWRTLELAALDGDAEVPWRLPVVADGCIFCPACTRVCPTDAIRRVFDEAPPAPAGGGVGARGGPQPMRLELEVDRCVGCDACVDVCPVHVIAMADATTWADLTAGPRTVARSGERPGHTGVVARDPS